MKIGEPNINCAFIPLNSTYDLPGATKWLRRFLIFKIVDNLIMVFAFNTFQNPAVEFVIGSIDMVGNILSL
jgi:hypothetical protein